MLRPLPPIVPVLVLLGGRACLVEKVLRSRFARGHGRWQCPAGRRLQCSPALPGEYPSRTQIDWSAGIIEMLVTHERHVLDRAAKGVHDGLQCIVRRRTIHWRPSWTPLAARSRTCRSCVTSISMMPADQSICVLDGYSPGRAGLHCNRRPAGHCHLPCPRAKRLRRTFSTRHALPPSRTSTGTMGGKGLNIYKPFPELCESAPARSKARSVVRDVGV